MTDQSPTVFGGRYELHRRVARGGMADVYLARDQLLDRQVAVKVLFAEFATDPTFVERFRREAKAAASLNHPNIVGIFDWGEENGTYYIVMEYVEGRSLAQILSERGQLDPNRAADIASEVAAALGHAHDKGVAHRDVKPGNVLISNKGEVKVADFGIATAMYTGAENNLTQTGSVMGTASYFSPEQAQGKPVDPRSDLYSLGVVLYEMLAGVPPFTGDTPVSIAYKHVQEAPRSPLELSPDIPVSLAAITMKLLAKNPENRYPTGADLRSDLGRYRSGAQLVVESPPHASGAIPQIGPTTGAPVVPQFGPAPGPSPAYAPATQVQPGVAAGMGTQVMPQQGYQEPGYQEPGYREPPSRQRPGAGAVMFLLVLLALAALAVLLIIYINNRAGDDSNTNTEGTIRVESVFRLTEEEAIRRLETQNLVADVTRVADEEVEAGLVISQDPRGGEMLKSGDTVKLVVSAGRAPIEIPDVVGLQRGDAERRLDDLDFVVEVVEVETDDALEGNVMSQEPPGGELRPPGSTVVLQVVIGPESKEVPDVRNRDSNTARDILREAGFVVTTDSKTDSKVPEGDVIETIPKAGEKLKPGETVEMKISAGPPTRRVPDVRSLSESAAVQTLVAAGFAPEVGTQETKKIDEAGFVLSQVPAPRTELTEGEVVTIFLGRFVAPPTATPRPPTPIPPTPIPPTPIPPTPIPPTPIPPTPIPPTPIPPTPIPPTPIPPTPIPDQGNQN